MAKSLVIVESPAKAKTINKFLGRSFVVRASMGHVRDLPKSKLGVDVEHGFVPDYVVIPARKKVLAELKSEAKHAERIYLAPDPDREGEAISFHLAQELGGDGKIQRVMFNEITKKAIEEAFRHPREIDQDKVDAQQARRVLDRLVGYQLSPLLWEKVRRGLSAGRVQSVALRIVCEREREIQAFQSEEYWSIHSELEGKAPPPFVAKLTKVDGKNIELVDEASTSKVVEELSKHPFTVETITAKERRRKPVPPFITSKLQQEASRKLGFTAKRAMMVAQRLYEGIEIGKDGAVGLITYMRTDSTRVADEALAEARQYIGERFGKEMLPDKPNVYKSKKGAQDAHEAIRPTSAMRDPDSLSSYLDRDELKLYRLIWNRFVASQMPPAVFDETIAEVMCGRYTLRARGSVLKFQGFLALYEEGKDDEPEKKNGDESSKSSSVTSTELPPLTEGEVLKLIAIKPEQHFTQPPPRFSEATLVKELEEKGIGRPSTYASILSVLQDREYVNKAEKKFVPTELGFLVTDLLTANFADIMQIEYTAQMEAQLDQIEEGEANYLTTIDDFYKKFSKDLVEAQQKMTNVKAMEIPTEEVCDKCGKPMVIKWGRFGHFLACSGYPECRNTREIQNYQDKESADPDAFQDETCEKCERPMVLKKGRYGQFLACSGYPDCKNTRRILRGKDGTLETKKDQLLDEKCPKCGNQLVLKHGRYGEFTACSAYPDCKYIKQKEVGVACPKDDCSGQVVERRSKRGKLFYGCGEYPDCDFTSWYLPVAEPCPECGYPVVFQKNTKRDGPHVACTQEGCGFKRFDGAEAGSETEAEAEPAKA